MQVHWNISGHIISGSSILGVMALHCKGLCIQTHQLMHKNPLHLCRRFVPAPFCTKGPCLIQKPSAQSVSIGGFCTAATHHWWASASILRFLLDPSVVCQAAQYRCQSVILNTHCATLPPIKKKEDCCVVSRFFTTAASSQT